MSHQLEDEEIPEDESNHSIVQILCDDCDAYCYGILHPSQIQDNCGYENALQQYKMMLNKLYMDLSDRDMIISQLRAQHLRMQTFCRHCLQEIKNLRIRYKTAVQELENFKRQYEILNEQKVEYQNSNDLALETLLKTEVQRWKKESMEIHRQIQSMNNDIQRLIQIVTNESRIAVENAPRNQVDPNEQLLANQTAILTLLASKVEENVNAINGMRRCPSAGCAKPIDGTERADVHLAEDNPTDNYQNLETKETQTETLTELVNSSEINTEKLEISENDNIPASKNESKQSLLLESSETEEMKTETEEMKTEMEEMKTETEEMKTETEEMKSDTEEMKTETEEMKSETEEMKSETEEMKTETDEIKTNPETASDSVKDEAEGTNDKVSESEIPEYSDTAQNNQEPLIENITETKPVGLLHADNQIQSNREENEMQLSEPIETMEKKKKCYCGNTELCPDYMEGGAGIDTVACQIGAQNLSKIVEATETEEEREYSPDPEEAEEYDKSQHSSKRNSASGVLVIEEETVDTNENETIIAESLAPLSSDKPPDTNEKTLSPNGGEPIDQEKYSVDPQVEEVSSISPRPAKSESVERKNVTQLPDCCKIEGIMDKNAKKTVDVKSTNEAKLSSNSVMLSKTYNLNFKKKEENNSGELQVEQIHSIGPEPAEPELSHGEDVTQLPECCNIITEKQSDKQISSICPKLDETVLSDREDIKQLANSSQNEEIIDNNEKQSDTNDKELKFSNGDSTNTQREEASPVVQIIEDAASINATAAESENEVLDINNSKLSISVEKEPESQSTSMPIDQENMLENREDKTESHELNLPPEGNLPECCRPKGENIIEGEKVLSNTDHEAPVSEFGPDNLHSPPDISLECEGECSTEKEMIEEVHTVKQIEHVQHIPSEKSSDISGRKEVQAVNELEIPPFLEQFLCTVTNEIENIKMIIEKRDSLLQDLKGDFQNNQNYVSHENSELITKIQLILNDLPNWMCAHSVFKEIQNKLNEVEKIMIKMQTIINELKSRFESAELTEKKEIPITETIKSSNQNIKNEAEIQILNELLDKMKTLEKYVCGCSKTEKHEKQTEEQITTRCKCKNKKNTNVCHKTKGEPKPH